MVSLFGRAVKHYYSVRMPLDRKRQSINAEDVRTQPKRCRSSASKCTRCSFVCEFV